MDDKGLAVAGGIGAGALAAFCREYSLVAICAFWGALVALTLRESLLTSMQQLKGVALVFVRTSIGIVFSGIAVYCEKTVVPNVSPGLLLAASAFGIAAYGPELLVPYLKRKLG